jgi:predicted DNA-binding transcriptional regulator YafY
VNEAPHTYEGRVEDVNDAMTGLLREERLRVRHASVARGRKRFLFDPYILLIYKKGVYLVGHSHQHGAVRTFALDGFRSIDWLKGQRFTYPIDYQPSKLAEGAFGLIGGRTETIRIFFDARVARYVRRRVWHASQTVAKVPGGIELSMRVAPSVEVASWILGFSETAEVRAPESLRDRVAGELRRAVARYQH